MLKQMSSTALFLLVLFPGLLAAQSIEAIANKTKNSTRETGWKIPNNLFHLTKACNS